MSDLIKKLESVGWDKVDDLTVSKIFEDVVLYIHITQRDLMYREAVRPVTDTNIESMVRDVVVPWTGLKIFSLDYDRIPERLMFAVKSDLLQCGLRPFRDEFAVLGVFDSKQTAYVNDDYPNGWSDNNVL